MIILNLFSTYSKDKKAVYTQYKQNYSRVEELRQGNSSIQSNIEFLL